MKLFTLLVLTLLVGCAEEEGKDKSLEDYAKCLGAAITEETCEEEESLQIHTISITLVAE